MKEVQQFLQDSQTVDSVESEVNKVISAYSSLALLWFKATDKDHVRVVWVQDVDVYSWTLEISVSGSCGLPVLDLMCKTGHGAHERILYTYRRQETDKKDNISTRWWDKHVFILDVYAALPLLMRCIEREMPQAKMWLTDQRETAAKVRSLFSM
jgi:hypothetical protein